MRPSQEGVENHGHTDDWVMAMCIADAERRRAQEQAEEEREELREEYDEWCEEHGIDPPRGEIPRFNVVQAASVSH